MLKILGLLMIISTSACSTIPSGTPFTKAAAPNQSQALVYVYRPDTKPWARSPDIFMNGTKVIDMKNQGYSYLYAKPGHYKFESKWAADVLMPERALDLDLKGGKTYFVRQYSTMEYYVVYWTMNNFLKLMDKGTALNEIAVTRYVPPFVKALDTTLASNQKFPLVAGANN